MSRLEGLYGLWHLVRRGVKRRVLLVQRSRVRGSDGLRRSDRVDRRRLGDHGSLWLKRLPDLNCLLRSWPKLGLGQELPSRGGWSKRGNGRWPGWRGDLVHWLHGHRGGQLAVVDDLSRWHGDKRGRVELVRVGRSLGKCLLLGAVVAG